MPRAIEICQRAIAAGQCVVIGLQTTGQAADDALYGDKDSTSGGGSYGAGVQRELADLRNSSSNSMKMDWLPAASTGEGVSSFFPIFFMRSLLFLVYGCSDSLLFTQLCSKLFANCIHYKQLDTSFEEEEEDAEFASAPAATLRRVINKLFPLPPLPRALLRAQKRELQTLREARDQENAVYVKGRRQRECVVQYNSVHRPHLVPGYRNGVPMRDTGTGKSNPGNKLKRKHGTLQDNESESEAELFASDSSSDIDSSDESSAFDPITPPASPTTKLTTNTTTQSSTSANHKTQDKSSTTPYTETIIPPHGTNASGINGWSIQRDEGWILLNPTKDSSDFATEVIEAAAHQEDLRSGTVPDTPETPDPDSSNRSGASPDAVRMEKIIQQATIGAVHNGEYVRKKFRYNRRTNGVIVGFLPAVLNEDQELWHVVFTDGDEEDWDQKEVCSIDVSYSLIGTKQFPFDRM